MSKRLRRYPKAPGIDHLTNTSTQFPQTSLAQCPVTSEVPYYPPVQSQPAQNMWSQSPYPNSSTYQPNQAPPVSEPSSYWGTGQVFPMQTQQPSDPWNWKVENNAENSSYPNYQHQQPNFNYLHQHPQLDSNYQNQHPQLDPNYQQPQQPQPDPVYHQPHLDPNYHPQHQQQPNPNYQQLNPSYIQQPDPNFQLQHQQPDPNYHPPDAVYQQHHQQQIVAPIESWPPISKSKVENRNIQQTMTYSAPSQIYESPLDSQPTNNNSNNSTLDTSLQSWENGSLNITEPAELPWTYSAPQYCNPPTTANFTSNSVPASVPWNLSPVTASDPDTTKPPTNNLSNDDSVTNGAVDIPNSVPQSEVNELKDDSDSSNTHDCDTASINRDLLIDTEFGTSSLSAFFQNSQNNSGDNSEYGGASTPDVKNILDSSSLDENLGQMQINESEKSSVPTEDEQDDQNLEDTDDCGNQEINFIQEENIPVDADDKEVKDSPSGFVEEPVNQEVPEPNINESVNSSSQVAPVNQDYHEMLPEEPLNQQIPAESGNKSRSTSSERERVVIRPREESPFKPPRINNNAKGTVVQQEISEHKIKETVHTEDKTVVHEVNLETFPDNLERPPDYEELRKQSSFYVSHQKHLRTELNSSPSSLLCDNPDIPCVTLAPAAPPIHSSSKSDKSESSSDSRRDMTLYDNPATLKNTAKESNHSSPVHADSELSEQSYLCSGNNTIERKSARSSNKIPNSSVITTQPEPLNHNQNVQHPPYPYLKDSIIKEVGSPDEFRKPAPSIEYLQNPHSSQGYSSSHSDYSTSSRPRTDKKYVEHETEFSSHGDFLSSRPRTDGKYAEHEAEFSSHGDFSSSRPRTDRKYAEHEEEFSSHSDISSASRPRTDRKYAEHEAEYNRQKFADRKYPSFDERQYYSDRERSRPPSRSSLDDRSEDYRYPYKPRDYPYPPHDDRRQGPSQDYVRPPSRMSESDVNRPDRHGQYDYYKQQYPYNGPYNRNQDYYQKPQNYRGYDYDPYQRDPYAAYYDAYRYAYSNYNYGFYDELYRNDPRYQQYRQEQYRQYYAKYGYEGDYERSSAHSGRSSANELTKEMASNQYPEHDMSSNASEISAYNTRQDYSYDDVQNEVSLSTADHSSTPSTRLTPVKFPYAHPIARFSAGGMLITAIPSQVDSSLPAPVKLQNMQLIMENEDSYHDLKNYQGPLIRGLTHKNDVVEFCNQRIKVLRKKDDVVDRDSYILLWELMILLLRQNGSVAGSDIAELLLKDHEVLRPHAMSLRHTIETPLSEQSPAEVNDSSSQSHAGDTSSPDEGIVVLHDKSSLNTSKTVDVDKVTWKFREFLLFGHKKDALEWAMKHGLWGHALFLASKMDLRTYANVMTRFANSLALNDPLQTLYQLMSGRQPSAVTCVADKKWDDWRPHLAMILSNPSTLPDVDSRSITTLGDTLAGRGCLPAAHFCYIMAQVDFGAFEQKNSKLVLLSTDHRLSFEEFATNEAIQCTEIYEYAQSLANPGYLLIHLQMYKYLYALRLVEHGFLEEALHYCEVIAGNLQSHPTLFSYDLIAEVFKLASRLKYHDPHFLRGQGEYEDQDDPEWLKNLALLVQNYNNILQGQNTQMQYEEQPEPIQTVNDQQLSPTDNGSYQNVPQPSMQTEMSNSVNSTNFYQQNNWNQQTSSLPNAASLTNNQQEMHPYYQSEMINNQNNFQFESSVPSHEENETTDVPSSPVTQTPPFDYYSGSNQQDWSSVHSLPSVSCSDVGGRRPFSKSDLESLVKKEESESDIAFCSSANSTPLHNYLLSKDYSDDRQMLMTSNNVDIRILNSCLKSKHSLNSKNKKCIKFDSSVSGHQGRLQRTGIRRRKFSKKRNEVAHHSDSSPEGSPSKEKNKSKLSLLATLGILRSEHGSSKLTKRKRKAKKKNETFEKLLQSKKTFAIDEPCDTDDIQRDKSVGESTLETKKIISILKKMSDDEKKNSQLSQLMANEFNKKPPLIFGGTYPIDEPFESKRSHYFSKNTKVSNPDLFESSKMNLETGKKSKQSSQSSRLSKLESYFDSLEKVQFSEREMFTKMSPLKMLKKIHSSGRKLLLPKEDVQAGRSASGLNSEVLKLNKNINETIVSENRQPSYDQVNNYATTATRRERRDSALSSGSRYSAGNLSATRKPSVKEASKPEPKKETKPSSQAGKTWLGGIFSRLLPKAPNQMILPDDKNPTIVWDEVNKCWVNKDSNDEDETNAPLAPPTDMELMGSKSSEKPSVPPGSNSMPPVATSPVNKFQRPKTRGMRQNYVDILNNSGATTKTNVPPEALFPSPFEQTSVTNMFVPPSVPGIGENSSELESTNSFNNSGVETEEQSQVLSAPLMFDPAEFDSRRSNMPNQRVTLGRTGRRTYPT